MNASADETEPLGEAPDVPARSGVAVVLEAADHVRRYALACQEIRELHRSTVYTHPGAPDYPCCHACTILASDKSRYVGFPCETTAILDRLLT